MTRRRGTILKRGNKYAARLGLHGQRVWLGSDFPTQQAAQDAIDKAARTGEAPRSETVEDFARRWVEDFPRTSASTNQTNFYNAKRVAEIRGSEAIAHLKLHAVTRPQARRFAIAHKHLLPVLRAMFNDAREDGLVDENPFAKLRLPKSKGRANIIALTEEEVDRLAEAGYASKHPLLGTMIEVMFWTGMRTGELFELRWEDIDFPNGTVRIRRRMKSDRGATIVLYDQARAVLEALPRPKDGGLIFTTRTGRPFVSSSFSGYWQPVRDVFEAGLDIRRRGELAASRDGDPMDFYELRHAHISVMLDKGADPMDIAIQVGHKGTRKIEEVYGHPRDDLARERLRRVMGKNVAELRSVDEEASHG